MLPTSLRIIYALSASTFQVSSIALLSIVNTRVTIPAEYLPAYGAISFLPYSLRPVFAWLSSLILHKISDNKNAGVGGSSKDRHDKLLCPEDLKKFNYLQDDYKFCSEDGKLGKYNNTCSLKPS